MTAGKTIVDLRVTSFSHRLFIAKITTERKMITDVKSTTDFTVTAVLAENTDVKTLIDTSAAAIDVKATTDAKVTTEVEATTDLTETTDVNIKTDIRLTNCLTETNNFMATSSFRATNNIKTTLDTKAITQDYIQVLTSDKILLTDDQLKTSSNNFGTSAKGYLPTTDEYFHLNVDFEETVDGCYLSLQNDKNIQDTANHLITSKDNFLQATDLKSNASDYHQENYEKVQPSICHEPTKDEYLQLEPNKDEYLELEPIEDKYLQLEPIKDEYLQLVSNQIDYLKPSNESNSCSKHNVVTSRNNIETTASI